MKITGYGVFVWILQIGNIYSFRENSSSGRLDSGSEPRLGQTKEKKTRCPASPLSMQY
jgi:hypothetical protein